MVEVNMTSIHLPAEAYVPLRPSRPHCSPHAFKILQHPRGQKKQLSLYGSQLRFGMCNPDVWSTTPLFTNHFTKPSPGRVWYTSGTEPGSSGSPVFDVDWNLIALHSRGVARHRYGLPYFRNGSVAPPERKGYDAVTLAFNKEREDELDWIANEGVRMYYIFQELSLHLQVGSAMHHRHWDTMLQIRWAYLHTQTEVRDLRDDHFLSICASRGSPDPCVLDLIDVFMTLLKASDEASCADNLGVPNPPGSGRCIVRGQRSCGNRRCPKHFRRPSTVMSFSSRIPRTRPPWFCRAEGRVTEIGNHTMLYRRC